MSEENKDYYDLPTMVEGDRDQKNNDSFEKNRIHIKFILIVLILICILFASLFLLRKVTNQKPAESTLNISTVDNLVYEVGTPIKLEASDFVTSKKEAKEVTLSSDLMEDTNKYTYDETTHEVVSKGKSYLEAGNYTVTLSVGNNSEDVSFRVKDTKAPEFVDFKNELYIDQNAEDVNLNAFFFAKDLDTSADISVSGDVNYSELGDYTVQVTAQDKSGNKNTQPCVVHIIDPDALETYSCMIDGSIPLSEETKQKVEANVITFYYDEVSDDIKNAIDSTHYDVKKIENNKYYRPSEQPAVQQTTQDTTYTTEYNPYG